MLTGRAGGLREPAQLWPVRPQEDELDQVMTDAMRAHSDAHDAPDGMQRTAMHGLYAVRLSRPGEVRHRSRAHLLCIVGQGAKTMTFNGEPLQCTPGDTVVMPPQEDVPMQIIDASPARPYLAFAMRIDAQLIAELAVEMAGVGASQEPLGTSRDLAQTAARMVHLLDRPAALAMLGPQLRRELHYWLLAGRHGAMLRQALAPKRHAEKIARALAVMRREFRAPLAAERLAAAAGLGMSAFYESFRAVTAQTPLQYQKQLRLTEARRLLTTQRIRVSDAAYRVGYESVPQFVREYRRAYGATPGREALQAARRSLDLR